MARSDPAWPRSLSGLSARPPVALLTLAWPGVSYGMLRPGYTLLAYAAPGLSAHRLSRNKQAGSAQGNCCRAPALGSSGRSRHDRVFGRVRSQPLMMSVYSGCRKA